MNSLNMKNRKTPEKKRETTIEYSFPVFPGVFSYELQNPIGTAAGGLIPTPASPCERRPWPGVANQYIELLFFKVFGALVVLLFCWVC